MSGVEGLQLSSLFTSCCSTTTAAAAAAAASCCCCCRRSAAASSSTPAPGDNNTSSSLGSTPQSPELGNSPTGPSGGLLCGAGRNRSSERRGGGQNRRNNNQSNNRSRLFCGGRSRGSGVNSSGGGAGGSVGGTSGHKSGGSGVPVVGVAPTSTGRSRSTGSSSFAPLKMGGAISHFFQTGQAILSSSHNRAVSEATRRNIKIVFDALRANPKVTTQRLEGLLTQIPRSENVLQIHNEEGYNLLQKCVGLNNLEMSRWCLTRNIDINRGACSLPLHIACLKGYEDVVELLLKHGARVDVEARMCWPGPHQQNCEKRGRHSRSRELERDCYRGHDKLQCAIYYAIDGDQVDILELLAQQGEDHWLPWQQKRPLLHIACERGAWNCVKYLVSERSDEINQCYDEYYPIHQAALHDIKFLELLIQCGADTTVHTSTEHMTALHVVLLQGKKTAEDTLQTMKLLMENGLRTHINDADSLGNTPLHVLIVRYALEERRYGYHDDHQPWNKWDMLHIVRYLLQTGARPSINQTHNSALACVLRHITDWEFRYDLLHMLLQEGGDPNVEGRDGSVPLMVCLVPLINKNLLHHFTHTMKVCYLNCVRILCEFGANPNCASRSNLTPLHVLVFTASENISLARETQKSQGFDFIRKLLSLLLAHGLDPNVRFSSRFTHILHALMDMVTNARVSTDLNYVYDLTLTLLQHGANPNVLIKPDLCQDYDSGSSSHHGHYSHHHYRHHHSSLDNNSDGSGGGGLNPTRARPVLYHYVQLLMLKDKLCQQDPEQHFARIIRLYYLVMNHSEVYSCLRILQAQTGMVPAQSALNQAVKELQCKPRTLKQMARVVIYDCIGQKPALMVSKLPLPPALREYCLNFDP